MLNILMKKKKAYVQMFIGIVHYFGFLIPSGKWSWW